MLHSLYPTGSHAAAAAAAAAAARCRVFVGRPSTRVCHNLGGSNYRQGTLAGKVKEL